MPRAVCLSYPASGARRWTRIPHPVEVSCPDSRRHLLTAQRVAIVGEVAGSSADDSPPMLGPERRPRPKGCARMEPIVFVLLFVAVFCAIVTPVFVIGRRWSAELVGGVRPLSRAVDRAVRVDGPQRLVRAARVHSDSRPARALGLDCRAGSSSSRTFALVDTRVHRSRRQLDRVLVLRLHAATPQPRVRLALDGQGTRASLRPRVLDERSVALLTMRASLR